MRVHDTTFSRSDHFDIVLSVCGYEERSTHVARSMLVRPDTRLVIDYAASAVCSYDKNRTWFTNEEAQLLDERTAIEKIKGAALDGLRIRVDISSMRRQTLASLVTALYDVGSKNEIQFAYAPAAFEQSSSAVDQSQVLTAGAMTPNFEGALRPSNVPLGLIAGLGLEKHRVLGLTELLEPARVWTFLALSDDPRFPKNAISVNQPTVDDPHTTVLQYDVRSISGAYASVESLVYAASQSYRLVLAPSGPKVFTLACLLASVARSRYQPAVWRVGPQHVEPHDVGAAGDVVAAEVCFSAEDHRVRGIS